MPSANWSRIRGQRDEPRVERPHLSGHEREHDELVGDARREQRRERPPRARVARGQQRPHGQERVERDLHAQRPRLAEPLRHRVLAVDLQEAVERRDPGPHLRQRHHDRRDRQRDPVGRHDPQRAPPRVLADPHPAAQERAVQQVAGEQEEHGDAEVEAADPRLDRRVLGRAARVVADRVEDEHRERGDGADAVELGAPRHRRHASTATSAASAASDAIQPIRQLSGRYSNSTRCSPAASGTPRKR